MSLQGKFEWYESLRAGGRKMATFILTCDNMFQSETFDAAIMSHNGTVPTMVFRNVTLKARKSLRFDYDSVDWEWCDGDTFVILGKNDRIKKRWPLNLQTYASGECPDCHGTHRCRACSGRGFVYLPNHNMESCRTCGGTGVCQRCYVPTRTSGGYTPSQQPTGGNTETAKRQCERIRRSMMELQTKIQKTEWDIRMMQLRGTDITSSGVYLEYNNLLYRYNVQMIELQSQLEQLENMR